MPIETIREITHFSVSKVKSVTRQTIDITHLYTSSDEDCLIKFKSLVLGEYFYYSGDVFIKTSKSVGLNLSNTMERPRDRKVVFNNKDLCRPCEADLVIVANKFSTESRIGESDA